MSCHAASASALLATSATVSGNEACPSLSTHSRPLIRLIYLTQPRFVLAAHFSVFHLAVKFSLGDYIFGVFHLFNLIWILFIEPNRHLDNDNGRHETWPDICANRANLAKSNFT